MLTNVDFINKTKKKVIKLVINSHLIPTMFSWVIQMLTNNFKHEILAILM